MNDLDAEHDMNFKDEKEDHVVSSDSDNFSTCLSGNHLQSEKIDLKEFKDDSSNFYTKN